MGLVGVLVCDMRSDIALPFLPTRTSINMSTQVSSTDSILDEEEPRLPTLFPDTATPRARRFRDKKVFFMSSRVHPGEVS